MKAALPAPFAEKCADMANRIRRGSSLEAEAEKLRGETVTNYTKARIMYALILWLLQPRDMATEAAFTFILDWRKEILRDGLFANADVPDDNKLLKILSRPSRTKSPLWEAQGHEHCTDGQSLLERIYAVRGQITKI